MGCWGVRVLGFFGFGGFGGFGGLGFGFWGFRGLRVHALSCAARKIFFRGLRRLGHEAESTGKSAERKAF